MSVCIYNMYVHRDIYIQFKLVIFFLHFSRAGTVYTHTGYRDMPHLHCFLHSTVGWLAGVMSSRQCCSW